MDDFNLSEQIVLGVFTFAAIMVVIVAAFGGDPMPIADAALGVFVYMLPGMVLGGVIGTQVYKVTRYILPSSFVGIGTFVITEVLVLLLLWG